jgi:tetratricopeptide (TPR) repeat protein
MKSLDLPIEISDPFSVGVQLSVIIEYLDNAQLSENATTSMFCEQVIMPMTEQYKCSIAEYLRAVKPLTIGKPVAFISHAWKYNFRALIDSLVGYFGKDAFICLDIVCCNQHKVPNYPFEWWSGTFKTAISGIGKTVMVLAPWNNPIPLTRGWCIWELYCTIDSEECAFDIAMTAESERAFVDDMDQDPVQAMDKMLATIDCANSECSKKEDQDQIHKAVRENNIGFSNMNKRIFETLRDWVIRKYKEVAEKRKREFGENHDVVLTTLNNLALIYANQGDFAKAVPLYEECLKKRKLVLGENHPDTLQSLHNLAGLYYNQGDHHKGFHYMKNVWRRER